MKEQREEKICRQPTRFFGSMTSGLAGGTCLSWGLMEVREVKTEWTVRSTEDVGSGKGRLWLVFCVTEAKSGRLDLEGEGNGEDLLLAYLFFSYA